MKEKLVTVKLIEQKGPSALVEWRERGRTYRAFVPALEVNDGKCPQAELEAGTTYGEQWEDYISGPPTAKQIAEALRNSNVWTMDDLFERQLEVKQLLQSLYSQVFVQFMRATRGGKKR